MNAVAQLLQQRQDLWRATDPPHIPAAIPTGHPALDEALGGGWPSAGLCEILQPAVKPGIAVTPALPLLLPGLARLTVEAKGAARWIALIAPPLPPYAPGFAAAGVDPARLLLIRPPDSAANLWAIEQSLRLGGCSAVLAWPERLEEASYRRLQLAAEQGESLGFLFRDEANAPRHSPAAIRLLVRNDGDGLRVDILKRRGGWPKSGLRLPAGKD